MAFGSRVFRFQVEGPPPIKRRTRGNNHYTDAKTKADELRVREAFQGNYPGFLRSENRFSVEIKIFSRKNCDGDNVEKAILDALNKVLWESDRQVKQMFWTFPGGHEDEPDHVEVVALEL